MKKCWANRMILLDWLLIHHALGSVGFSLLLYKVIYNTEGIAEPEWF